MKRVLPLFVLLALCVCNGRNSSADDGVLHITEDNVVNLDQPFTEYPDDSKLYPFKEDEYQAVDKLAIEAGSMHMMERHAIDSYNVRDEQQEYHPYVMYRMFNMRDYVLIYYLDLKCYG